MEFDTSKLFSGKNGIEARITPMDFPFLIIHAFDRRENETYVPTPLRVVLAKCYELFAEDITKPEQLRDVLMRTVKASGSDSGIFGLGKLPLNELFRGRSYVTIVVGVTGTKIRLRRFGDCLGIRPVNDRDELHEKASGILARLADDGQGYVRHFIHRYSFSFYPDLKSTASAYVLDVQQELTTMDRYLPDIKWIGSKRLAADLGADFISHRRVGVKVGSYGDADVFARIIYEQEVNDQAWRQGKVRNTTGNDLSFGTGAGDKPRIEYFLQMMERESFDPARSDIDYQREQGLLRDLARMLYAGLYQRGFQSIVKNGNEHWIRFRRETEKAAV